MSQPREAIDGLRELGLTEDEARCFVALPQLPHGTAVWSDGVDHAFATSVERVCSYELKENAAEGYGSTESE